GSAHHLQRGSGRWSSHVLLLLCTWSATAVDISHPVSPPGRGCGGGNWHSEKEGAALAQDALNPNRPVVGLNNLLDECQSQPGAPNMARLVVLHSEKLAEEFW